MAERRARKRRQIEVRQEKADQALVHDEQLLWERMEEIIDQEEIVDHGDLVGQKDLVSQEDPATALLHYTSKPTEDTDEEPVETKKVLKRKIRAANRKIKELESESLAMQQQLNKLRSIPVIKTPTGTSLRTEKYKRTKGKKLSDDERRAILHLLELCFQEKNLGKSVSTADPFLRTAVYFGVSPRTVRDAHMGKNLQDFRRAVIQAHDELSEEFAQITRRTDPLQKRSSIPIGSWDTHSPVEFAPIDGFLPRPFRREESIVLQDQRMAQALKLLTEYNILQCQQLSFDNRRLFRRFMIYAIDNNDNNRPVPLLGQSQTQIKQALIMVLLNMNVDPWIFSHKSEQTPDGYTPITIFQSDQSKRLLDIYLDMPSPRASNDPYMCPDIQPPPTSVQRILDRALSQDIPKGMRTKLYGYQKNSLWKLLRRELCPDYLISPTLIPVQDMNQQTYYINVANNPPSFCRNPLERWEDVRGGIICEDMGTGKSCLCIALIMQTRDQFSQPPASATRIFCELYPFAPPSAIMVRDGTMSVDNEATLLARGSAIPTLRDLAAAAVKINNIEYRKASEYINDDTMEMLEAMSVYYYAEESTSRTSRTRGFRMAKLALEVYLSSSTLVIVPPDLTDQWCNEVNKHAKDHALKLLRIESDDKEIPDHRTLMKYDMVLITQNRFTKEYEPGAYSNKHTRGKAQCQCKELYISCRCPIPRVVSPLMQVHWKRVIVDEGHSLGVKMSDHTLLAEVLHADRRWVCTGTPTFNLGNLMPSSSSSNNEAPVSDKGDLDRLSTLMRLFLHIQPYYEQKTLFSTTLVKPLREHHSISTGSCSPSDEWSLESLSSIARLRHLMDRIMVRNKPEDVINDVKLPPLYERIVGLDLEFFQVLTINCYVGIIQANAVLSEREDQDYFFHPSNRKHLSRVIENLKDGCFWNPAGKDFQSTLRNTLDNVKQAIQKHRSTPGGKYPEDDFQLLVDIRNHLNDALMNDEWRAIQKTQEVGYYCGNLPMAVQQAHALIPSDEVPPVFMWTRETATEGSRREASVTRDSENVCVMLANQITNLRSEMQKILQTEEPGYIPTRRISNPQPLQNNHPIVIDLDPIRVEENTSASQTSQASNAIPPSVARNGGTLLDRAQELKSSMTREQMSKATIICSTSSKLNYIASQILRHQKSEKAIVFCQGQTTLYYIHEYLTLAKVRCQMYHTHGMTKKERSNNIMTFNTSENVSAIIMDIKHGAHGIDLSSASRVYFVSPVWQTSTMRQAVKRAHRIGQTRPVFVETLVIKDSLEEAIMNRRKEIDDREESSESTLTPELGLDLVATSATHMRMAKIQKPKNGGKEIVDDSKIMHFMRNIKFMSLPARGRSLNWTSEEELSNRRGLMDSWKSAAHTYRTSDDQTAFKEDDSKYNLHDNSNAAIPFLFPNRNSWEIQKRRQQTESQHVSTMDQSDEYDQLEDLDQEEAMRSQDSNSVECTESLQHRLHDTATMGVRLGVRGDTQTYSPILISDDEDPSQADMDIDHTLDRESGLLDPMSLNAEVYRSVAEMGAEEPDIMLKMTKRKFIQDKRWQISTLVFPSTPTTLLERMDTLTLNNRKKEEDEKKISSLDRNKLEWRDGSVDRKVKIQSEYPTIQTAESSGHVKSETSFRPKVEVKDEFAGVAMKPEPEYYILFDHDDEDDNKGAVPLKFEAGGDNKDAVPLKLESDGNSESIDSKGSIAFVPKQAMSNFYILLDDDDEDSKNNEHIKNEFDKNELHSVKVESANFDTKATLIDPGYSSNNIQKRSSSLGRLNREGFEESIGSSSYVGESSSKKVRFI
ncbi:hypothetical protein BGX20_011429 [Mortierella sp. AD010]|nr:hypothetical protein BGX20_011429 [Mortierella sp. AD010]